MKDKTSPASAGPCLRRTCDATATTLDGSSPAPRASPTAEHGSVTAALARADAGGTLVARVSRILLSTLDHTSALRDLTAAVADDLGCDCIVDVAEPDGSVKWASTRAEPRDVDSTGAPAEWRVCVPIALEDGEALGALTLIGRHGSVAHAATVKDIAELAAMSIRNGRAHRAAMECAHERERVLSLVAHELNNPLGVILLGALRGRAPVPDHPCPHVASCRPRVRELDAIQRAATRMKKLVSDLLDIAAIDAGRLSLVASGCDVAAVISATVRDLSPFAESAGVELCEEAPPRLPTAWVDGHRIGQVLVNLVCNAVKFTPRGGHVRVRCGREGDGEILVAVEDSGHGIAPADLGRIFDLFWRASSAAQIGTGLGLAICKSIVELSGGRIWAESTPGVGTTISFTLPIHARA